jgi:hypothetical protein
VCGYVFADRTPAAAWKAVSACKDASSTQGSGILKIELTLTLLEARVLLVDDVELAITADQFAVHATLFHRGFYFHDL